MSYAGSLTIETPVWSWVSSHVGPKLTLTVPLLSAIFSDILFSSPRSGSSAASAPLRASILGFRGPSWVGCLFIQTFSAHPNSGIHEENSSG